MLSHTKQFPGFSLPPNSQRDNGLPRRVGFELEFSGIGLDSAMQALQSALGLRPGATTAATRKLVSDELGEFVVELDWAFLKRLAAEQHEELTELWIERLSRAAELIVPVEVVCPPIPVNRLDCLNPMVAALREAGAIGTEESFLAAYGVHINIEIPQLDASTLFDYLRAYALLQWWLVDRHEVDLTRRISPYIDLYPEAYLKSILSRASQPMDLLLEEYLKYNPTRNRALDLLPMLAEVNETRVFEVVQDTRVQARPAFHYRLPNCHIERPDWWLVDDWNTWLVVEKLASKPQEMDNLGKSFLESDRPLVGVSRSHWVEHIDQWVTSQESA